VWRADRADPAGPATRLPRLARILASPGLLGQGIRFALTGGLVAIVYLTTTTVLADVVGLPFQAALVIGFCLAISVHFTLQRRFVWASDTEFALGMSHQVVRYLVVAGCQYGITAASTLLLPKALGLPTTVVYLATALLLVAVNFVVFRNGIFHARSPDVI
jgi:putative flippase GtrA